MLPKRNGRIWNPPIPIFAFFAHFYYFRLPFLCKSTFIQKIVENYSKGFAKIKKYVIIII